MERTRARARPGVPTWLDSLGLVVVAGFVLLSGVDVPVRIFFDETYYVEDARGYLATGVEPTFAVHPPVGKWLIAAGIRLLGDDPVGWRVVGVVAGLVMVLVLHRLALRLLRDVRGGRWLAAVAPVLLLLDGVFFVQARIAMLDIFLALFVLVGIWLVVVDRDRSGLGGTTWPAPGGHALRWLAGVAFGLALGVKWSGLLGLGVAGLLVLTWELALRQRAAGGWWRGLPRLVLGVGGSLVLVPVAVYALTWIPWGMNFEETSTAQCDESGGSCTFPDRCDEDPATTDDCDFSAVERALGVLDHQGEMWRFHAGLEADHPYRSQAVLWPILERPVVYYYETCSEDRANGVPQTETDDDGEVEVTEPTPCIVQQGEAGEVVLLGNPVTWWGFLLLTPLLVAGTLARDRRSLVALLGWAGQFLPWLVISRVAFLFYMVPAVAFQALAVPIALVTLRRRGAVAWPYAGAALGGAAGFGLGQGASMLVGATTVTPAALALGGGWLLGAVVGAVLGARRAAPAPAGRAAPGAAGAAPATTRRDLPTGEPLFGPPDADGTAAADAPDGHGTRPPGDDAAAPGPAPSPAAPPPPARRGARERLLVPTAAALLVATSLGLAVWFQPVWRGTPLPVEQVRDRWWFSTWV